jgi:hypothetical protein
LFGEKNLQNGKIEHDYAEACRKDETKCGVKGLHFKLDV